MNANYKAHVAQEIMYKLWHKWRNSTFVDHQQAALKAKTLGAVYWDRVMFPRKLTK